MWCLFLRIVGGLTTLTLLGGFSIVLYKVIGDEGTG